MDATDGLWSLGVILYEMVKGQKPFYAEDTRRLEQRITSRRPPESLEGACSDGLRAIVAKLLAPSSSSRYDDARLIREDLERCLAGESTIAQQEGWPDAADVSPATRRTRPASALPDEATRPTPRPAAPPAPALEGRPVAPAAGLTVRMAHVFSRFRWLSAGLIAIALMAVVVVAVNQVRVYGEAASLSGAVHTSDGLADLMKAWIRYDELSSRSYLRVGVRPLERALVDRTQVMADRVIRNYSTGVSGIRETQWKEARAPLLQAVAAAPDDQRLRATLRFIDGHLHRIDGNANSERQQMQAARKEFAEALTAFREAAELRPQWPDPFLGLARTFIAGLGDLEKGEDAIAQAQRLGYRSIEPEILLLAEGYRKRGDTLTANASRLAGTPQEEDSLMRAHGAYARSLELYASLPSGGHPDDVRTAQRGLNRAGQRLDRLTDAADHEGSSDRGDDVEAAKR
jgi:tetratricopeptide (TPR) repeat protein